MQLVDSHCHIDFDALRTQLPAVLARAADNDVAHLLCVAVNLEDFPRIARIAAEHSHAQSHPRIHASVGVHPNATDCHEPSAAELIELARDSNVIAIGETGLDYFRTEGEDNQRRQQQRFENHIVAAKEIRKPLIIHTRAAADDTMEMLERLDASDAGGVMHCFAEDWQTAERALNIGFYISFSGIVTFNNADALRDVARRVPLDRMLVETDCPYLAPVPHRGKTNEPAFVRHTAQCIADLRGETLESIADATTENFYRLFAAAAP